MNSINRLSLAPHFKLLEPEKNITVLLNNTQAIPVKEELYQVLLKLINKEQLNSIELMERLLSQFDPSHVLFALDTLKSIGYIIESINISGYYMDNEEVEKKLHSICQIYSKKMGLPPISLFTKNDDKNWDKRLKEIMNQGTCSLPILFEHNAALIGPFFDARLNTAPCPACLRFRINHNNTYRIWLSNRIKNIPTASKQKYQLVKNVISSLEYFFKKKEHYLIKEGSLFEVTIDGQIKPHLLMKRSDCSTCGTPGLAHEEMNKKPDLSITKEALDFTCGYRSTSPEDTWRTISKFIDTKVGIISEILDVSDHDFPNLPVFKTIYPTMTMNSKPKLTEFHEEAFGKGRNALLSKISATCEAIERACARFYGNEPIISKRMEELENAVPPSAIQHFHEDQLNNPTLTHELGPIPRRLNEKEIIDFLPAWSIRDEERRFIPIDAVLYGHTTAADDRVAVFESNGLSAGNSFNEAVTQGLFELIERDATAIWWFNKLRRPAANLSCMSDDEWFQNTIKTLSNKCQIHFLDLTIDTAVPVIAAIAKFDSGFLIGYGCHLDLRLALSRALTELVQVQTLMKPVNAPVNHKDVRFLYPHQDTKKFDTLPFNQRDKEDKKNILNTVVKQLAKLELDTIVVNCTRLDIQFPVAKVIVPGLRAFRPRFGHGRLYEVPVKLGLQQKENSYKELNPMWLTIKPYIDSEAP